MSKAQIRRASVLSVLDGYVSLLSLILGMYFAGIANSNILLASCLAGVSGALSMGINEIISMNSFNSAATSEQANPYKIGLYSFGSFMFGSFLAIFPFALGFHIQTSLITGLFYLYLLGYMSVEIKEEYTRVKAGWRTLVLGILACSVSVGLGLLAGNIF